MTGNRTKKVLTTQGAELKNRVARTRSRAQFAGIVYFVSIIVLAIAACLPLFDLSKQQNAPIGVFEAVKMFKPATLQTLNSWTGMLTFVNALLYMVMLLVVLINVIRASTKLCWLCKRKASKTYGFNRNVYAMSDLGKIFSGSYAMLLITYFLIAMLNGAAYPNLLMYIVFVGGAFVHVFAGVIGGKASYFNIEEGQIKEDARIVGMFAAFFRNLLQLALVFFLMDQFQKINVVYTIIGPLLEVGAIQNYVVGQPLAYIPAVMQLLGVVCMIPLIKHATATTEYNIDGAYGAGMKTFRIFCFLLCGVIGLAIVGEYYFGGIVFSSVDGVTLVNVVRYGNWTALNMFVVTFVMFIIEILMRNMPGHKKAKAKAKKCRCNDDDEDKPAVVLYVYR